MVEFFTTGGIAVDLLPNQDLTVTLDNAFLSSDHTPVAWTTDAEAAPNATNCELFGYPDAMLFPFQRKEINVEMRINSLPVMLGKLKMLGPTRNSLKVSFVGVSIEDSLTGSLKDAPFNKWDFGLLNKYTDNSLFKEVIAGAAANTREDFATPLMMRESEKDTADDYVYKTGVANPYEFFATKYLNCPKANYIIPVVKLKYILQTIFSDCKIDDIHSKYFEKIGIVAPYQKNIDHTVEGDIHLPKDENQHFILDLADAMPDVTVADFVKDLLSTFCATIYITKDIKLIISNNTIIQSQDFIDWSDKVADDMEQEFEAGQSYEYGYPGITDTEITEDITDCQSINDCMAAAEGAIVRCSDSGDIYKKIKRPYLAGADAKTYYVNGLEILRQEGMLNQETADKSLDTYSATSSWVPVKSLPYIFINSLGMSQWPDGIMTPIVEMPTVGGTRPSTIQFGTLEAGHPSDYANEVQLTSNGNIGVVLDTFLPLGAPLNLRGSNGLYEKFHQEFKEWLEKDKTVTKVSVNLTAADISNLRIWRKVMLYNQLFFIKTLSITLNTSTDNIRSEAELIAA